MKADTIRSRARALVALASLSFACASAAEFPERPVRFISPFSPGGSTDIVARLISQAMAEHLGQPVLVDNRGGAGGNVGTAIAAKAAPDGYTVLMGVQSPLAINVTLYGAKLPFDPVKDFAPISLITKVPQVYAVHASLPVKNVRALIALARAKPNEVSFGSAGSGTTGHLVGELFKSVAAVELLHVPYKSSGAAMTATLSGEVAMIIAAPPAVLAQTRNKRLVALAVSSAKRAAVMPQVPTMRESGVDIDASSWYSMVAPAGTPRPIIDRLRAALLKALATPQVAERMTAQGAAPETSTPEELAELIRTDIAKWRPVVQRSGARVE